MHDDEEVETLVRDVIKVKRNDVTARFNGDGLACIELTQADAGRDVSVVESSHSRALSCKVGDECGGGRSACAVRVLMRAPEVDELQRHLKTFMRCSERQRACANVVI